MCTKIFLIIAHPSLLHSLAPPLFLVFASWCVFSCFSANMFLLRPFFTCLTISFLCSLPQIPWQCRSLASGPIGAWWHTGRRRHASGASTRSRSPLLDIFYDLPQGNGFCLGQLCSDNKSQLVQMVRAKIGYGIQLTREPDGVWVYNRSCYPIFIKSATLDNPDSRTLLVHKVFPGFSIKAFDYDKAGSLQRPNDHEFTQQPRTGFTVQISFVKGWGQCYTRQFISSCPCWLEVIFNTR